MGMKYIDNPVLYKSNYYDNFFNVSNFNYYGDCGKIFKYKRHNSRDLLFYGIGYNAEQWKRNKPQLIRALGITCNSIPFATKVMINFKEPPPQDLQKEFNKYKVQVIQKPINNENPVNQRYIEYYYYLLKYKKNFDRVLIIDIRDVFIFGDIFSTFSSQEIVFSTQCYGIKNNETRCNYFGQPGYPYNDEWLEKGFNKEIRNQFCKNKYISLNAGVVLGGIEPMFEFLRIMKDSLLSRKEKLSFWGIEQATLNYLYYTNAFKKLNTTVDQCTQRTCFSDWHNGMYNNKTKIMYSSLNGCSPVLRHKIKSTNHPIVLT
ncbi:hypothetical protein ENUP19_0296G0025 [Entamoeba nuttalli]